MKLHLVMALAIVSSIAARDAFSQTFDKTSGDHFWNDDDNWGPTPPQSFPNDATDVVIIQAVTADLTIDLGQAITVGSILVEKATTGTGLDTTIVGSVSNTLKIEGGSVSIENGSFTTPSTLGTGATIIAAPVVLTSGFTVTQRDNDELRFNQPISGIGNLTIRRDLAGAGIGDGVVVLSVANTYTGGATNVTGLGNDNFTVVRLGHVDAIPATSNLFLTNGGILDLAAGDFTRPIGVSAGEIQFSDTGRNGWGAVGADRKVILGGTDAAPAPVLFSVAKFNQLALGSNTSTATVNFRNPLSLDTSGDKVFRSYDGSAAIDGVVSGIISGIGNLSKQGDGILSLTAANTYSGTTKIQGGVLRIDPNGALGTGNLQLGNGAVLGIGTDMFGTVADGIDFSRNLGTGAGAIRMNDLQTGNNAANSGFAAFGADRVVQLSVGGVSGAMVTWASGNFFQVPPPAPPTPDFSRYFILSADTADGTLEFKNPINLNGAARTVVTKNGTANIDAKLSGVLSGTGASGLIKDNPGTLEVSAANTYAGATRLNQGVLLLTNLESIPGGILVGSTGGNIEFAATNVNNIGVLGLGQGDFTRNLGTGTGQVQFIGHGGWAAYGANRVVNLGGGSPQMVTWGVGSFVPFLATNPTTMVSEPGALRLGAVGADATVDFQNPIDLNGGARTVSAGAGSAAISGVLSGAISGAGGSLIKVGSGTLSVTAANTYDGGTTVSVGRLLVNNTTGSGVGSGDVTVSAFATLGGTGFIGTLADTANVTVSPGAHIAPGSAATVQVAGELSVVGNVSFADPTTVFDIELGSVSSFDKLTVDGTAGINGVLNVTLLGGYTPVGGESYQILSATGGVTGTFASVLTPTVTGIDWEVAYNATNVILTAAAAGVPGDYNGNDVVDAADYVLWRSDFEPLTNEVTGVTPNTTTPEDYDAWRERFGDPNPGSGSGLGDNQAVPEPTTFVSLAIAALVLAHARRSKATR